MEIGIGFFGDLINAVVGAVADAIIDALEPVVEYGCAMGEIAEDISDGAEDILAATSDFADANGDGEIDDEDAEEDFKTVEISAGMKRIGNKYLGVEGGASLR